MRVSAILVVNDQPSATGSTANTATEERRDVSRSPIACAEILGQSVLERTVTRLRNAGIEAIVVIGGPCVRSLRDRQKVEIVVAGNSFARWPAAQSKVREQQARGIGTVVMIGLGAYTEFGVAEALKFHLATGTPLTQVEDNHGPLDFWIVDTRWFGSAANGCTLPFRYGEFPGLPVPCRMSGYVNRLAGPQDLRQLVMDSLLQRCEIRPLGKQVKPGIWIAEGARVHKTSRLVAPVYVGRGSRVGPSAVLTRFSNLERNAEIGSGTVVDSASVLPHTVIGAGLDVSNAIVDGGGFLDLNRNVALHIDDPHLVRDTAPPAAPVRDTEAWANRGTNPFDFQYAHLLSRAAGRLSEVLFRGQV